MVTTTATAPTIQTTGDVIVQAQGLTKRYGAVNAVDHLSFDVYRGEILGFLGPNGSGKSTTPALPICGCSPNSGQG